MIMRIEKTENENAQNQKLRIIDALGENTNTELRIEHENCKYRERDITENGV